MFSKTILKIVLKACFLKQIIFYIKYTFLHSLSLWESELNDLVKYMVCDTWDYFFGLFRTRMIETSWVLYFELIYEIKNSYYRNYPSWPTFNELRRSRSPIMGVIIDENHLQMMFYSPMRQGEPWNEISLSKNYGLWETNMRFVCTCRWYEARYMGILRFLRFEILFLWCGVN